MNVARPVGRTRLDGIVSTIVTQSIRIHARRVSRRPRPPPRCASVRRHRRSPRGAHGGARPMAGLQYVCSADSKPHVPRPRLQLRLAYLPHLSVINLEPKRQLHLATSYGLHEFTHRLARHKPETCEKCCWVELATIIAVQQPVQPLTQRQPLENERTAANRNRSQRSVVGVRGSSEELRHTRLLRQWSDAQ